LGEVGLKWAEPELVVAALHTGALSTIPETLRALGDWAEGHGYRSRGVWREVYHFDRTSSPESRITEIQLPVDRVA
jgi:effector-binding domain-containing protein